MNIYAESSAVLSWLLGEKHRTAVQRLLRTAEIVFTSDLTLVECERVLIRAVSLKEMTESRAESCRNRFITATARWHVLRLSAEVIDRARRPFPGEPIRTLDALHLASAIVGQCALPGLSVLSLDKRIRSAAQQLGFNILPKAKKTEG